MRSILFVFLILAITSQHSVQAATFVGESQVDFRITEYIDGVRTEVTKPAPVSFVLTTDYKTIEWELRIDVDLLLAGSPTQPFETRLKAKSNLKTDALSPLSFPDTTGTANAGTAFLIGPSEWTLSDRIVTATDSHHSIQNNLRFPASSSWPHLLSVFDYPNSVRLTLDTVSSPGYSIGQIGDFVNGVDVRITFPRFSAGGLFAHHVTLREQVPGDFATNGWVDAADYVVWREAPGLLAPFLTSYPVWRSNFGESSRAAATSATSVALPEPHTALISALLASLMSCMRRSRRR